MVELPYFDPKSSVRLTAYADAVILENTGGVSAIAAIRFGGYPEMVRAMWDAIYVGGAIAIPGAVPGQPDGFDGVENVTGYLTEVPGAGAPDEGAEYSLPKGGISRNRRAGEGLASPALFCLCGSMKSGNQAKIIIGA